VIRTRSSTIEAVPVVRDLDARPVRLDEHGALDVVDRDRQAEVVGVEAAGAVVPAAGQQVPVLTFLLDLGLGRLSPGASGPLLRRAAEQHAFRGQRQQPR
jgi:hypothetical protein